MLPAAQGRTNKPLKKLQKKADQRINAKEIKRKKRKDKEEKKHTETK